MKLISFWNTHRWANIGMAIILVGIGYWGIRWWVGDKVEIRYVLSKVERGEIVISIAGSGQVESEDQIDLKPKASGDVVYIGTVEGEKVVAGALIAQLDAKDAKKAVRDAEVALESAKLALEKLQKPADTLATIQAENALASATADATKSQDDASNTISNAFLDLPGIMTGLQDVFYGTTASRGAQDNLSAYTDMVKNFDARANTFKIIVEEKYIAARTAYDENLNNYKSTTRFGDVAATNTLLEETWATIKLVTESLKSGSDLLNLVKDDLTDHQLTIPASLTTHQSTLTTYTSQINGHLGTVASIRNAMGDRTRAVAEKTESLAKLKRGADPLDIASQRLIVKQRENALLDARTNLENYFVRAPFNGTVANIAVKKYDAINSGTIVATLVSDQQIANISLNEVDVARVSVGQKATLTFDAVEGLTMTGKVAALDTVGMVSQGVVTYNAKILFDTRDARVKSGMSVSAAITTDIKEDVLIVPISAIKERGNRRYVERKPLTQGEKPTPQWVEIGLTNDTHAEIANGLQEGDEIIVRTITAQPTTSTPTAPSIFGAPSGGGNRGSVGGGAIRFDR